MKKCIFFIDITGTILGNVPNSEEDYNKLNILLRRIKEFDDTDEIIFSLISTDNIETIRSIQNLLIPYIGNTVTFGRQFFENGYYTENYVIRETESGKIIQMCEYLKSLCNNSDEITSVYFADDVEMYHLMFSLVSESESWENKIHSIIPIKKSGLNETNHLLEESIEKEYEKIK